MHAKYRNRNKQREIDNHGDWEGGATDCFCLVHYVGYSQSLDTSSVLRSVGAFKEISFQRNIKEIKWILNIFSNFFSDRF